MNKKIFGSLRTVAILIIFLLLYLWMNQNSFSNMKPAATKKGSIPQWGKRTKTSGCDTKQNFPDKACTPGDVLPNITKDDICRPDYSKGISIIQESESNAVFAEYGIGNYTSGRYEVDHFVSLELGGSNDISNLWPELVDPKPGFHEKDKVEDYLRNQVCSGAMTLEEAQIKIVNNWLDIYNNLPK